VRHAGHDVAEVARRVASSDRPDEEVARLLRGRCGALELDFRARLVTILREFRVWPKDARR
jgi:hypothetical protein